MVRHRGRRVVLVLGIALVGIAATALSAALSYGPAHAWAWLGMPVRAGIWLGMVLAALTLALPQRVSAVLLLVVLTVHLALLNDAPPAHTSPRPCWSPGNRAFHPLLWSGPVAGLAVAFCRVGVCTVAGVAAQWGVRVRPPP